jgi:MFS family permease
LSSTTQTGQSIVNRTPVYYGWVIWLVAVVGLSASMPGQTANVSLFIDRWIADFGLTDRSTISALYGIGTFFASLTMVFIGNRLDRFGARTVGVAVALIFAAALVYMSFVNGLVMLAIGFFLIRMLGQGALSLINTTAVANWFQRLRGRVMALTLIGFGLFQRVYIPFIQELLERMAWQQVWLILAALMAFIVAPVIWVFMREKPEQFGVLPDGDGRGTASTTQVIKPEEYSFRLREAMRTPIFWVFLVGGIMNPMFLTGLIFHQESVFAAIGYDTATAAATVANAIAISAFVTLPIGWLLDTIPPGWVRAMELAALAGVMILSNFLATGWMLAAWAVLLGMAMGTGGVFGGTVWANLFGREYLGEIRGFITTVQVTATALGPILLAASFDITGSYATALYTAAVVALVPMLISPLVQPPRKQTITA